MNAALNTGTTTGRELSTPQRFVPGERSFHHFIMNFPPSGWGRGTGWSVQGDPAQILCYYAAAEAAIVDLSASDLAFDIPGKMPF